MISAMTSFRFDAWYAVKFSFEWFYHNTVCEQKRAVAILALVDNLKPYLQICRRFKRPGHFVTPFIGSLPRKLTQLFCPSCRVIASIACTGGNTAEAFKSQASALIRLADVLNVSEEAPVISVVTFTIQ